ncbi:MAG: ABC transporter permease [Chitinophagia bacterium]|nr:ABC transporter permease [Chitinophagia bacterium]
MNKIALIIQREYLSRVKKKSFLLVTFGVPLLFIGMFVVMIYLIIYQSGLSDKKKVLVADESGWFAGKLHATKTLAYTYESSYTTAKATFIKQGYDYCLHIPANLQNIQLISEKKPNTIVRGAIEDALSNVAQAHRLSEAHIDSAIVANAQKPIKIEPRQLTETGEKDAHIWAAYSVGLIGAFIIYLTLLLYGAQVMRGVIEEKVSRIVEVIISSVKPIQLMLGKIIGVGLVGLTQFVIWIVLTGTLLAGVGVMGIGTKAPQVSTAIQESQSKSMAMSNAEASTLADSDMGHFLESVHSLPLGLIVVCFLFYFLFGYFLYSALFAAVGSAVDSETETQQFMLPITLPLVFTIMLSNSVIINNPDSNLSVWLSMIPLTSPIAMMIRLPFGVPAWQLALSMLLLLLGFLGTVWVAARIYRVGILMYGKKANYKELMKWITYKE